jgi:hypothetical protein
MNIWIWDQNIIYCITILYDTKGTKYKTIKNCLMHVSVFTLGHVISDQVLLPTMGIPFHSLVVFTVLPSFYFPTCFYVSVSFV